MSGEATSRRQHGLSSPELPDSKRRRLSTTTRIHVLYWENSSDQGGIKFDQDLHYKGRYSRGPSFCRACSNVADVWKCRMDNMQTSIRMCVDSQGMHFRDEVEDFVCLSQNLVIKYNLKKFEQYNRMESSGRLTEESVVGTAMKVLRKQVEPRSSGVEVTEFEQGDRQKFAFVNWLRNWVSNVRKAADDASGLSTGLMLDKNGVEINSFGVSSPMFAHEPERPISEVVILLGGPKGIEDNVLPAILNAFDDTMNSGFHLRTVRVKLPGGLQHSYVALGDLLNYHDRGHLVPILEDYQFFQRDDVQAKKYSEWYSCMVKLITTLAESQSTVSEKKELLEAIALASQKFLPKHLQEGGSISDIDAIEWLSHKDNIENEKQDEEVTPADVEKLLSQLEGQNLLPRRRGWRARQCLQVLEPRRALAVVRQLDHILQQRLLQRCPVEDPWAELAEKLDKVLAASATSPAGSTEQAVAKACKYARVAWGEDAKDGAASVGLAMDVKSLRRFPCSEAVRLVKQAADKHERRPSHGLLAEVLRLKSEAEEANGIAEEQMQQLQQAPWRTAENLKGSAQSPRRQPHQPSHPPPGALSVPAVPRPPSTAPPPNLMAQGASSGRPTTTSSAPAASADTSGKDSEAASTDSSSVARPPPGPPPGAHKASSQVQRATAQSSRALPGPSSGPPAPPPPPSRRRAEQAALVSTKKALGDHSEAEVKEEEDADVRPPEVPNPAHFKCPTPTPPRPPPKPRPAAAETDVPADGLVGVKKESQHYHGNGNAKWDTSVPQHWNNETSQQWKEENPLEEESQQYGDDQWAKKEPHHWSDRNSEQWKREKPVKEESQHSHHNVDDHTAQWKKEEPQHWDGNNSHQLDKGKVQPQHRKKKNRHLVDEQWENDESQKWEEEKWDEDDKKSGSWVEPLDKKFLLQSSMKQIDVNMDEVEGPPTPPKDWNVLENLERRTEAIQEAQQQRQSQSLNSWEGLERRIEALSPPKKAEAPQRVSPPPGDFAKVRPPPGDFASDGTPSGDFASGRPPAGDFRRDNPPPGNFGDVKMAAPSVHVSKAVPATRGSPVPQPPLPPARQSKEEQGDYHPQDGEPGTTDNGDVTMPVPPKASSTVGPAVRVPPRKQLPRAPSRNHVKLETQETPAHVSQFHTSAQKHVKLETWEGSQASATEEINEKMETRGGAQPLSRQVKVKSELNEGESDLLANAAGLVKIKSEPAVEPFIEPQGVDFPSGHSMYQGWEEHAQQQMHALEYPLHEQQIKMEEQNMWKEQPQQQTLGMEHPLQEQQQEMSNVKQPPQAQPSAAAENWNAPSQVEAEDLDTVDAGDSWRYPSQSSTATSADSDETGQARSALSGSLMFTCPQCWSNTSGPTFCNQCGGSLTGASSALVTSADASQADLASAPSALSATAPAVVAEGAAAAADLGAAAAAVPSWPAESRPGPALANTAADSGAAKVAVPSWLADAAAGSGGAAVAVPTWMAGSQPGPTVTDAAAGSGAAVAAVPSWLAGSQAGPAVTGAAADSGAAAATLLDQWLAGSQPGASLTDAAAGSGAAAPAVPSWLAGSQPGQAASSFQPGALDIAGAQQVYSPIVESSAGAQQVPIWDDWGAANQVQPQGGTFAGGQSTFFQDMTVAQAVTTGVAAQAPIASVWSVPAVQDPVATQAISTFQAASTSMPTQAQFLTAGMPDQTQSQAQLLAAGVQSWQWQTGMESGMQSAAVSQLDVLSALDAEIGVAAEVGTPQALPGAHCKASFPAPPPAMQPAPRPWRS